MRIVLFHPVRLPPRDYGGVERVVLWLAEALRDFGHEVHVGAIEGSELPRGVRLIPVSGGDRSAVSFLKKIPAGTDVIHFMAPPENEVWMKLPCTGILTVHGNGKPGEVYPRNTVFLTADHAERHGRKDFVWNGVNPEEYRFVPQKSPGARPLFLSKTSWKVKNLKGAIRFCDRAQVGLTIAGGYRPISLLLSTLLSPHEWVGPTAGAEKAHLLKQASGLIFPVLWPEPFGLVVVEAMISGTPVLAPPIGSLPELITPECGSLLDLKDEEAWVAAIRSLDRFSPEACRMRAMTHFTHHQMAKNYLVAYEKAAQGELR